MTDPPIAYRIEVRSGPLFGEEEIRSIEVPASEGMPEMKAIEMVESFRSYYENREEVTWDGEEVDGNGVLSGLAPEGISYRIVVTPPIPTEVEPTQPTLW
jgi:hypothetical protein